MINPRSLENLIPFSTEHQPTVPHPKGASPLTIVKRIIQNKVDISNPLTHEMEKLSIEEVIAFQLVAKAFKGDYEAIKDIIDRIDGKALQRTSQEGAPAQVYAPSTVNYIAVYNNDRPNPATSELEHSRSGEVSRSIKSEGTV